VSDSSAIRTTADEVVRRFGRVDILINNAGIRHEDDALDVTDENMNRVPQAFDSDRVPSWACPRVRPDTRA